VKAGASSFISKGPGVQQLGSRSSTCLVLLLERTRGKSFHSHERQNPPRFLASSD
ncbi:thiamine pyrophosphokinase, partial [Moniliophthora roreri]